MMSCCKNDNLYLLKQAIFKSLKQAIFKILSTLCHDIVFLVQYNIHIPNYRKLKTNSYFLLNILQLESKRKTLNCFKKSTCIGPVTVPLCLALSYCWKKAQGKLHTTLYQWIQISLNALAPKVQLVALYQIH